MLVSPVVSRQHGMLKREGEDWIYTDLNSRNGTWSQGERIQTVVLKSSMQLQIGKNEGHAVVLTFSELNEAEIPAQFPVETIMAEKEPNNRACASQRDQARRSSGSPSAAGS